MKNQKINRIFTLGIPFILGVGAGWIVQGRHWDVFLTSYVPALATLVAAFYGAKYAFQFQKDKEEEDNKRRNVVNGNSAIFNLMRMANRLINFQKDFIEPVRKIPTRFINMPPALNLAKDDIKLNIETLYFLLETDDRNLLGELGAEETRYRSAIDAINKRSLLHTQEVQPLLERAGIVKDGNYLFEQIEQALGKRLYTTMQQETEQIINHVDSTIVSLKQAVDKLTASLKRQYPNEIIMKFGMKI